MRHRLLAAAVVIDPMWLIAERRQAQRGTTGKRRAFFGGAGATLAVGWSAMIGVAILLGTPQDETSLLGICMPLCLTAIVAPHLRTAAGVRCVCAAGVVTALTSSWPSGTGLLAAMAAGHTAVGAMTALMVLGVKRITSDPFSLDTVPIALALAASGAVALLGRSMAIVVLCGGVTYALALGVLRIVIG